MPTRAAGIPMMRPLLWYFPSDPKVAEMTFQARGHLLVVTAATMTLSPTPTGIDINANTTASTQT